VYIVAIAWLFVTILMAATEPSLTAAVLTLAFYGVAPLALVWWVAGTPKRRARREARRLGQGSGGVKEPADQPDREHAQPDE
jgi:hypothetical protein